MKHPENYPADFFFDIETLINVAQPQSILLLGGEASFLDNYLEQKALLGQGCDVTQLATGQIDSINQLSGRFDVAIAYDLFEHLTKREGERILSRLRDVLAAQYCICLPISAKGEDAWRLSELFAFALTRVAIYQAGDYQFGLFRYNLSDYKNTPDWLNSDNWANPEMWGKYRW